MLLEERDLFGSDERAQEITGSREPEISIEALSRVVDILLREREDEQRRIQEFVPDELRAQPYPPIEEMPEESPGAGRDTAPGGVPPEDGDPGRT